MRSALAAEWFNVDIPVRLFRLRFRAFTSKADGLLDFRFDFPLQLFRFFGFYTPLFELATGQEQRITAPPGFDFILRSVSLGVAEHMSCKTVGHRLDERRALPRTSASHGFSSSSVHGLHVVTVNDTARNSVSTSPICHSFYARLFTDGCHLGIQIVLTKQDAWQLPQCSHIQRFVERPLVGGPFTEECEGHPAILCQEGAQCSSDCGRNSPRHDTTTTKIAHRQVRKQHRAAAPAATSCFSTKQFRYDSLH